MTIMNLEQATLADDPLAAVDEHPVKMASG
jgi:hypothetical protein